MYGFLITAVWSSIDSGIEANRDKRFGKAVSMQLPGGLTTVFGLLFYTVLFHGKYPMLYYLLVSKLGSVAQKYSSSILWM